MLRCTACVCVRHILQQTRAVLAVRRNCYCAGSHVVQGNEHELAHSVVENLVVTRKPRQMTFCRITPEGQTASRSVDGQSVVTWSVQQRRPSSVSIVVVQYELLDDGGRLLAAWSSVCGHSHTARFNVEETIVFDGTDNHVIISRPRSQQQHPGSIVDVLSFFE